MYKYNKTNLIKQNKKSIQKGRKSQKTQDIAKNEANLPIYRHKSGNFGYLRYHFVALSLKIINALDRINTYKDKEHCFT